MGFKKREKHVFVFKALHVFFDRSRNKLRDGLFVDRFILDHFFSDYSLFPKSLRKSIRVTNHFVI